MNTLLRTIGHQNWLRFGIRDRIVRLFDNVDTRPSEEFTVPFFGKMYKGDLANYIDWRTYYFGAYAVDELSVMRDVLKGEPDAVVLDIGANVGHHSLYASTLAKHVHAFEPLPAVYRMIQEKIDLNHISNITIHPVGLGDQDTKLPYLMPATANSGTGTFVNTETQAGQRLMLPIRTGDNYLADLHLSRIDLIKMDIEGFEPNALRGLQQTLVKHRPVILFEWSANERGDKPPLASLFPSDYQFFVLTGKPPIAGLLNRPGYSLKKDVEYRDGYKVAIPIEKQNKF